MFFVAVRLPQQQLYFRISHQRTLMILWSVLGQFRKLNMFFNIVLHAESDRIIFFLPTYSLAIISEKPPDGAAKKLTETSRKLQKTDKKYKNI